MIKKIAYGALSTIIVLGSLGGLLLVVNYDYTKAVARGGTPITIYCAVAMAALVVLCIVVGIIVEVYCALTERKKSK